MTHKPSLISTIAIALLGMGPVASQIDDSTYVPLATAWSDWVIPQQSSRVVANTDMISVTASPQPYRINATDPWGNSIRRMRQVTGDFAVQMRVSVAFDSWNQDVSFVLYSDDEFYFTGGLNLPRRSNSKRSARSTWNTPDRTYRNALAEVLDRDLWLRIERIEDGVSFLFSYDGNDWIVGEETEMSFPQTLLLGLRIANGGTMPLTVTLTDLSLQAPGGEGLSIISDPVARKRRLQELLLLPLSPYFFLPAIAALIVTAATLALARQKLRSRSIGFWLGFGSCTFVLTFLLIAVVFAAWFSANMTRV